MGRPISESHKVKISLTIKPKSSTILEMVPAGQKSDLIDWILEHFKTEILKEIERRQLEEMLS